MVIARNIVTKQSLEIATFPSVARNDKNGITIQSTHRREGQGEGNGREGQWDIEKFF